MRDIHLLYQLSKSVTTADGITRWLTLCGVHEDFDHTHIMPGPDVTCDGCILVNFQNMAKDQ